MKTTDTLPPVEESGTQPEAPRAHSLALWILRLITGAILIGVLASQQGAEPVLRALSLVSWPVLLGAVVFYWAGQVLSAYKWQLLLSAGGAQISLLECCRIYAVGMFCNLWLPSSIGGDAMRAVLCRPLCGSASLAITSIFLERLTGVIALVVIGLCGFLSEILWGHHASNSAPDFARRLSLAVVIGICAFSAFVYIWKKLLQTADQSGRIGQILSKMQRALEMYSGHTGQRVLVQSLILSVIFQASQVVLNLALARAIGLQVSSITVWWATPFLSVASLLPIGIGGLGVREVAAVQLLRGYSLAGNLVLTWSLLWQATVWLSSLPGGLWWSRRTLK